MMTTSFAVLTHPPITLSNGVGKQSEVAVHITLKVNDMNIIGLTIMSAVEPGNRDIMETF